MLTYNLQFTRDFSLPMLEVWYKAEAYNIKPWLRQRQQFQPYIIFQRMEGTVKAFYDPRGVAWIKEQLLMLLRTRAGFVEEVSNNVQGKLASLESLYQKPKAISKQKLLEFIDNFEKAYPWVEALWWLCHMHDENELKNVDISALLELRKKTETLSSGTDGVVRLSLLRLYPAMKQYAHLLKIDEIKWRLPSKRHLQERQAGFFYTAQKLYSGATIKDMEKEFNIQLEQPVMSDVREVRGQTAYPGVVTGVVRRVMGHEHIGTLQRGEILLSPMTIPDFLPAMEKAAAIVTDEGGMLCHAAIVARELQKPCVVGTKYGTSTFWDGDKVEVNATKGIVRLVRRKER